MYAHGTSFAQNSFYSAVKCSQLLSQVLSKMLFYRTWTCLVLFPKNAIKNAKLQLPNQFHCNFDKRHHTSRCMCSLNVKDVNLGLNIFVKFRVVLPFSPVFQGQKFPKVQPTSSGESRLQPILLMGDIPIAPAPFIPSLFPFLPILPFPFSFLFP